MKKHVIMFISLLFISFIFSCTPAACALENVWMTDTYQKYSVNGNSTKEEYIINREVFSGTYSRQPATYGLIEAAIMVEKDNTSIYIWSEENNLITAPGEYSIEVKDAIGDIFSLTGALIDGGIQIDQTHNNDMIRALQGKGDLSFFIVSMNSKTNYFFVAECDNFSDLYQRIFVIPAQEAEKAEKAKAYEKAKSFLSEGKYDEAIMAFEALGNYKDSLALMKEATVAKEEKENSKTEALNEAVYQSALRLLDMGKYEEAIEAFEKTGDYKESAMYLQKAIDAAEVLKREAYEKAEELYASGNYTEAYIAFAELSGYSDVDERLKNDKNLVTAAREVKLTPFKTVGAIVTYGTYEQDDDAIDGTEDLEWIVLANEGDKSLLISRYIVDYQKFNKDYYDITWANSTIRTWLNGTFMDMAFSDAEKTAIISTSVDNSSRQGNDEWGSMSTSAGGKNTQDKIFLLSYAELKTYFISKESRICVPTLFALNQGNVGEWWLRSPGKVNTTYHMVPYIACVDTAGGFGGGFGAQLANEMAGIRPVIWVKLSSIAF